MQKNRNLLIVIGIFTVAIFLRIVLAYLNNGAAYDDHLSVCWYIINNGHIPKSLDCWQCYHPKLYHFLVAKIWEVFNLNNPMSSAPYIVAQEINAISGIFTLFIVWRTIKKLKFSINAKIIVFMLIAFNPRFIAINCQPSNDSLIILFGAIVIYQCHKFLDRFSFWDFLLLFIFSVLACLTKTSGFIVIIGTLLSIALKTIILVFYNNSCWKKYLLTFGFYCLFLPIFLYSLGDFKQNKENYGSYIVYNTPFGPSPHFFEKTNHSRPGIQSIFSGYFTFRLFDMLQHPTITDGELPIPLHRTSFFSQLYGYSNFLYFDNLNRTYWVCKSTIMFNIGRVALVLGLIPSLMLFIGFYNDFIFWSKSLFKLQFDEFYKSSTWSYSIFAIGFILFIFIFTYLGRDFSFIKIIYLFPGIVSILNPLLKGCEKVELYCNKNALLRNSFWATISLLMTCYIIPVMHLIRILLLNVF